MAQPNQAVAQQHAWVHFVQQLQEPQEEDTAAAVRDTVRHKLVQRVVAWFCPSNDKAKRKDNNTMRLESPMIHTLVHAQNNQGKTALQVAPPSLKHAMEKAIRPTATGTTSTNDSDAIKHVTQNQQQQQQQHEGDACDKDTHKDSQRQECTTQHSKNTSSYQMCAAAMDTTLEFLSHQLLFHSKMFQTMVPFTGALPYYCIFVPQSLGTTSNTGASWWDGLCHSSSPGTVHIYFLCPVTLTVAVDHEGTPLSNHKLELSSDDEDWIETLGPAMVFGLHILPAALAVGHCTNLPL